MLSLGILIKIFYFDTKFGFDSEYLQTSRFYLPKYIYSLDFVILVPLIVSELIKHFFCFIDFIVDKKKKFICKNKNLSNMII